MQVTARNKLGQKPEGQSPQVAVKRRDLGNAMYGYAWLGGDVRSLGKARMGAHIQRRGSATGRLGREGGRPPPETEGEAAEEDREARDHHRDACGERGDLCVH